MTSLLTAGTGAEWGEGVWGDPWYSGGSWPGVPLPTATITDFVQVVYPRVHAGAPELAAVTALKYDLIVEQGSDYYHAFPVLDSSNEPVGVTDWSGAGQIRGGAGPAAVLHQLDVTLAHGHAVLRIPAATSAAWAWRLARYDVELTDPDGGVTRLVEGWVVVRPEITRAGGEPSAGLFASTFTPAF